MGGIRLVVSKAETRLRLRFFRTSLAIGSGPESDLCLPGGDIPETAARLVDLGRGRYQLESRASGLPSRRLSRGERFRVGDFELALEPLSGPENGDRRTTEPQSAERVAPEPAELLLGSRRFLLDPSRPFAIGSAPGNDLTLEDRFVSARHCVLRWEHPFGWRVHDQGSTNGTRVGGVQVQVALLSSRARLEVGGVRFEFRLRDHRGRPPIRHGMVAASTAMQRVLDSIEGFAPSREPVMLIGASGTGKEGLARAVHDLSPRSNGPWLAINCGALSEQLVEAELFGHVRGAFTGADRDKPGAFSAAHEGTLFLDEIGELPPSVQPKLLRILETGTYRPVGGVKEIPVDVRIVAATHRNLAAMVAKGLFREDLFHRLFVLSVNIPPLRERPEDILALAGQFLEDSGAPPALNEEVRTQLLGYGWPGNARELRNVLVRATLLAEGSPLAAEHLAFDHLATPSWSADEPPASGTRDPRKIGPDQILAALRSAGGNQALAARKLGMRRSTFHDRVRRLGLSKEPG